MKSTRIVLFGLCVPLAGCAGMPQTLANGVDLTARLDQIYDSASRGADVSRDVASLRDAVSGKSWYVTVGELALGLAAALLGVGGARKLPTAVLSVVRALRRAP